MSALSHATIPTVTKAPSFDPVGVAEIAERLRVQQQTVATWHYRSRRGELEVPMPEPAHTVSRQPCWNWPEIEAWAKASGRL